MSWCDQGYPIADQHGNESMAPASRNEAMMPPPLPIHRSLGGTPSLLALLALGLTSHVQAQGRVFKSAVEVVPLTVTVTDARGKYLKNLFETRGPIVLPEER